MRTNHQAFFCSLFVARLADQILLFLVPLVVFQTTRQVSWSGLAFFIETLPRYLVFPFFGALCDRMGGIGAAVSIGAAVLRRKRALALGD